MIAEPVRPEQLSRLQPLAGLAGEALRELAPRCRIDRVARNLDPFALRDWSGQIVYLAKGELKIDFADGSLRVIVGGTDDALLPVSDGGRRPLSTKAITDVELLCFDEDLLDIVVTWDQLAGPPRVGTGGSADATDWRTMSGVFTIQNLTEGAFAALPPANIDALLGRFLRQPIRRGEIVVREGEQGDYYYVIESGRCLVSRDVAGVEVELAELGPGDPFGEEALITDSLRNATVTMKTDGVLLRLGKQDFVELLREPLLHRVAARDALDLVAAGATWLDVRFAAEFQHDGLPGAVNLPLNELRQGATMLHADHDYIAYCQSGRRSSAAAFLLCQRGFRVRLLEGGLRSLAAVTAGVQP